MTLETTEVLIPVRDGSRLAANLFMRDDVERSPAIVVYALNKDASAGRGQVHEWQLHFAERGYACLTVDARGVGASEGIAAPAHSGSDKEDGYDVLEWIAEQPWCNGTTGMWGISASGSTALAAASMRPPSLKAIIPIHATPDEYSGFLRPHGCRPGWWTENNWGLWQMQFHLLPPLHRDLDRRWARVWHERLAQLVPWPFLWHTVEPSTYLAWRSDVEAITAATYAVCAWHDFYPRATLDYYKKISAPKRVLIGPWKHELPDLAANWPIDHIAEMDRWWDHWLKGEENGVMDTPPVVVWHQGEDKWHYEETWPPGRDEMVLYAADAGYLTSERPNASGADTYVVDPTVGLDLLPWDPLAPIVPMPHDRSGDDHRSQTYTTPPLDEPLNIVGDAEATVALTGDQPEFPLSVWLADVGPTGASTLICQGWISATAGAGEPVCPDRVYEIAVPLYSTSYRVDVGHRLRLGLAGAYFPLLWPAQRNPRLTIQRSSQHATCVRIPVASARSARQEARPSFAPPRMGEPKARLVNQHSHRIIRDLAGTTAELRETKETVFRLADGSLLRMESENISTIEAARPDELMLSAHFEAIVDRPVDSVAATIDAVQTFDWYHIEAHVAIDGTPFYERAWDLDLV